MTFARLVAAGLVLAGTFIASAVPGAEPGPQARVAIFGFQLSAIATTSFIEELGRLGYAEGHNLTVAQYAENKPAGLPELAREMIRFKPDVILTVGTIESTAAAMKATTTIPIVFVHAVDPVRTGLVASLARPGGNVTGITSLNADLDAKRLELVNEIVPGVRRVVVLVSSLDPEAPSMLKRVEVAASARRVQLDVVQVRDQTDLSGALGSALKRDARALLALGSPPLFSFSPSLAELTAKYRLPAVSAWKEFPKAGGLASYGTNIPEMFQRAAQLVDRILKGAKPAELPVEQPTKFELVVNLKAAAALKLKIPESVLLRADEVIR